MANIVAGFGVPHTPVFPFFVKRDGPESEIAKLFAAQKEQLAAVRPEVIVMFDTDHLNTFFLDNLPIFAVGVDKEFTGPNDEPREMSVYKIPSAIDLAAHIRRASVEAGFDTALTQHYSVDHSVAVPLHFLTPRDAGARGAVLHKRPRAAAAGGAALLCARASGRPRHRFMASAVARRGHGLGELLAGSCRSAHGARPHRRRARPGLGMAHHQADGGAASRDSPEGSHRASAPQSRQCRRRVARIGSPCLAPSAITSRPTSPRRCRTVTLTACGAGINARLRCARAGDPISSRRLPISPNRGERI